MVLRIFKMSATSGFVTALKRTKFVFGRDPAPDPAERAYSAPPYPLAALRGPTSKGEGRREKEERRKEGESKGR